MNNNLLIYNRITLIDKLSSRILDNPYLFNYVRFLLAGKQKKMKDFIKNTLLSYKCQSMADICSGTGDFANLIPENASYVGWDINDDFVSFARNRHKNKKNKIFYKSNVLTSKKIIGKKFDAVLLMSAVHHFSDKDLEKLLPRINSIMNKVLVIADIIPNPPHPIQKFFARIDRGKFVRPAEEKIRILKKYFKVVKTQEISTRSAVQLGIVCEKKKK